MSTLILIIIVSACSYLIGENRGYKKGYSVGYYDADDNFDYDDTRTNFQ